MPAARQYRFGPFLLDLEAGFLRRDGHEVALRPKAFAVLAHLVAHHGRLIGKNDLVAAVWPDAAVTDNSLAQCLFEIRRALDDRSQTVIRTVARRGYVFDAPVMVVRSDASSHDLPSDVTPAAQVTEALGHRWRPPSSYIAATLFIFATAASVGYVWVSAGGAPSASSRQQANPAGDGQPATATIRSIAVLPFADLVGESNREYAAIGLSETIATELAALGLPRVVATAAAEYYQARRISPADMARALRVDALVVGSVVRDGAAFAVNVRLVEGSTEHDIWGARFARSTLVEVSQSDDIVQALARELRLRQRTGPYTARPQVTSAAREEYLRGRHLWNKRSAAERAAAIGHFTRAVQAQPDYALAWVGLADTYALGTSAMSAALMPWPGNQIAAGVMAAERAIALDPSLGEAYSALGRLRMNQHRWADAERAFARAVGLSPNYAPARQWYGTLLGRIQKCAEALKQVRVGAEIDPVTPIINEAVGSVYWMCGQPHSAVPAYRRVLELHPEFAPTHMRLGLAHLMLGDVASAIVSLRQAARLDSHCLVRARLAWALMASGDAEGQQLARSLVAEANAGRAGRVCAAVVQAQSGRPGDALLSLELAFENEEDLSTLLVDPAWTALRTTRRYHELIKRVGLAGYAAGVGTSVAH